MDYSNIILEKRDRIARITLNRPDKLNALSTGLLTELHHALDDVDGDQEVAVLILTGAGRAFSSGFDITPGQPHEGRPVTANWDATHLAPRIIMRLWDLRQPTIAAVHGFALAAGNVLAMTADMVIASEDAVFGEPEVRHVAPSPAIMLPYLAPFRHLNWFYFTGDSIDAGTAARWNMVNRVVPADKLQDEAWRTAERIAMVPPFATQMMKRSIRAAYRHMGFFEAFDDHLMLRMIESGTPDVPEREALASVMRERGLRAFLEARDGPFRT